MPQTALVTALTYLAKQRAHLEHYVNEGRYPINNKRRKKTIRRFVIGGKNSLFSHSIRRVRANANLYRFCGSLIMDL